MGFGSVGCKMYGFEVLVMLRAVGWRVSARSPRSCSSLNPRNLRIHILRLLGPKTILYKAFGLC